jgi:perosamine synthetase
VILPSYVCAALWLAIVRVGAHPRIVDIETTAFALDPDAAAKTVSARTKAIIVPHLFGLPAELARLESLGVPLIEDCAHTLTATEQGRQVGTVGVLTVCSFYATKLLCTGEGGMLLSKDPALLERARALREYDEEPNLNPASFNYKMTDLQAAIGLIQLKQLRSFLDRRAAIALTYQAGLARTGLDLPVIPEGRSHIFYRYVAKLRGPAPVLDPLVARLERRGVQCRRPVFRALHQYLGGGDYPATDDVSSRAL